MIIAINEWGSLEQHPCGGLNFCTSNIRRYQGKQIKFYKIVAFLFCCWQVGRQKKRGEKFSLQYFEFDRLPYAIALLDFSIQRINQQNAETFTCNKITGCRWCRIFHGWKLKEMLHLRNVLIMLHIFNDTILFYIHRLRYFFSRIMKGVKPFYFRYSSPIWREVFALG